MLVKSFKRIGSFKLNKFFFCINKPNNLTQVTSSGKISTELLSLMNEMKIEDKNLPDVVNVKSNITKYN
jgi:hypothetical protein